MLGIYYRHLKKNSNNILFKNVKITLHSLRNNEICLVAGDILKYKHNPVINEFLNFMYFNLFQQCILEPTRVVLNSGASLIDNIYINTCDKPIHSANFLDKVQSF